MTVEKAIETVRKVGKIEAVENDIDVKVPRASVERLQSAFSTIRGHRTEALALLGSTLSAPASGWQREQTAAEALPSDALKGYAVCLYSDLVGENLWIVADEEDAGRLIDQGERRGAVYTRAESRLVTRINDPDIVKQVHAFKREFNTRMLPPDDGK